MNLIKKDMEKHKQKDEKGLINEQRKNRTFLIKSFIARLALGFDNLALLHIVSILGKTSPSS